MNLKSNLAFVYPGQGSQAPGMGKELYENFRAAQLTFEEASDALKLDLKKLCFDSSAADLALTENTQPAILVTSVATSRVLNTEFELFPSYVAGHSIGEYAALVQAQVLSLDDAILAVRLRGQAMQSAVPVGKGAMAAVMGLTEIQALELCQYAVKNSPSEGQVTCANFNCPGQIVISGHTSMIEFIATLKATDIWGEAAPRLKVIPLNVSAPFHSPLMKPAQESMSLILKGMKFSEARMPIIQNVDAKPHTKAQDIQHNLIEQISAPVKWTQTMSELKAQGVTRAIEVGYGKVLSGLFKKSETGIEVMSTQTLSDIKALNSR